MKHGYWHIPWFRSIIHRTKFSNSRNWWISKLVSSSWTWPIWSFSMRERRHRKSSLVICCSTSIPSTNRMLTSMQWMINRSIPNDYQRLSIVFIDISKRRIPIIQRWWSICCNGSWPSCDRRRNRTETRSSRFGSIWMSQHASWHGRWNSFSSMNWSIFIWKLSDRIVVSRTDRGKTSGIVSPRCYQHWLNAHGMSRLYRSIKCRSIRRSSSVTINDRHYSIFSSSISNEVSSTKRSVGNLWIRSSSPWHPQVIFEIRRVHQSPFSNSWKVTSSCTWRDY